MRINPFNVLWQIKYPKYADRIRHSSRLNCFSYRETAEIITLNQPLNTSHILDVLVRIEDCTIRSAEALTLSTANNFWPLLIAKLSYNDTLEMCVCVFFFILSMVVNIPWVSCFLCLQSPANYTRSLTHAQNCELLTEHQSSSNFSIVRRTPLSWFMCLFLSSFSCLLSLALHSTACWILTIVPLSEQIIWVNWILLMVIAKRSKSMKQTLATLATSKRASERAYVVVWQISRTLNSRTQKKIGTSLVESAIKMIPWSSSKEQNDTWNANVHEKCLSFPFNFSCQNVEMVSGTWCSCVHCAVDCAACALYFAFGAHHIFIHLFVFI